MADKRKSPPIANGARAVTAPSWDQDERDHSKAFTDWSDVATTNNRKHNSARANTFQTPDSMSSKFATPGRADRGWGLGDTKNLQEICEQGFSRSMAKFHIIIMDEIKRELATPLGDIRVRIDESTHTQEKLQVSLEEMHMQVMTLQTAITNPVDFSPMQEEIMKIETVLDSFKDGMQRMEDRMNRDVSQILVEVQAIRGFEEAEADTLADLAAADAAADLAAADAAADDSEHKEKEKVAEAKVQQVSLVQQVQMVVVQGVRAEINAAFERNNGIDTFAKEINEVMSKMIGLTTSLKEEFNSSSAEMHKFHEEANAHNAMIEPTLAKELEVVNTLPEHFNRVIMQVINTQDVLNQDTKVVLQELAKVQQALNVDFAHVLDDMHTEIKRTHTDLIPTKSSLAIEDKNLGAAETSLPEDMELNDAPRAKGKSKAGKKHHGEKGTAEDVEKVNAEDGLKQGMQVTQKRFRHTLTQTDGGGAEEREMQTDAVQFQEKKEKKKPPPKNKKAGCDENGNPIKPPPKKAKPVGIDPEEMKKAMRAKAMKPPYNVQDFYHSTGCAQTVSTNTGFENFTLFIIAVNAIWIAIDTDLNSAETLLQADPVFIVAENLFCAFFTFEISVRFLSFNGKQHCLKDAWFMFDSILVTIMVIETWVVPVSMIASGAEDGASMGDASVLRLVRMARLVRMSRLAKLLKAVPELSILIKGIKAASRAVSVFLVLWLLMVYIFAIVCRMLSDGDAIGAKYFPSVPDAMITLFLDGILPDTAGFNHNLLEGNWVLFPIVMFFIILAGITVMYMLVGVLVDTVGAIASTEKEGMVVFNLAEDLRFCFGALNRDVEASMSLFEFNQLLANPDIAHIITDVGVDLAILINDADMIFEEPDIVANGLTFGKLVEIILDLRGNLVCKVKDTKDQIKTLKKLILGSAHDVEKQLTDQFKAMNEHMTEMMDNMAEAMHDRDGDHDEDDIDE